MKKIYLVRHAEASKDNSTLLDKDRMLSISGIQDCKKLSNYLSVKNIFPDIIYCSSARRCIDTLELIFQDRVINLDNKIVFGIDSEFDATRYQSGSAGSDHERDESAISQYFDYQFRPIEKLYATLGLRSDEHSTAGREPSGRASLAYQLDGNSKIRSSLGTGVRFPALYDYGYGSSNCSDVENE